jgi:NitT/TauT family transport system ATP-binding protein
LEALSVGNATHVVVRGLTHVYEGSRVSLTALDRVDLDVERGSFVSVIGPSGAGKTTLLKVLGGLIDQTSGVVEIDGAAPEEARRGNRIGFVFQDPTLLPWRTVAGNVALPLEVANGHGGGRADVSEHLQAVGLADFSDYYPHQLSGGMRQRAAFARALASAPELLLLDEPLGSLDEITRTQMRFELLRLWEGSGKTVVLVTHSVPEAVMMSDVVAVMSSGPGRIVERIPIEIERPRDDSMEGSSVFAEHLLRVRESLALGAWHGPAAAGAGSPA